DEADLDEPGADIRVRRLPFAVTKRLDRFFLTLNGVLNSEPEIAGNSHDGPIIVISLDILEQQSPHATLFVGIEPVAPQTLDCHHRAFVFQVISEVAEVDAIGRRFDDEGASIPRLMRRTREYQGRMGE